MGSKKKTSLTADIINQNLKTYFKSHTSSKMRVVVTHPDADHYNYFQDGLDGLLSFVDFFVLSGQYSQYRTFKAWLDEAVNKGDLTKNKVNGINGGNKCFGNDMCTISSVYPSTPGFIDPQRLCGSDNTVTFTILAANLGKTKNSQSVVLKIAYSSSINTIILPGDFETADAQDELVDNYAGTSELQANVYKIAHHGASRLANYLNYLKAIKPQVAFVSQAYPGITTYAHPRCDIFDDGLLTVGTILSVDPNVNQHSPFACGTAPKTARDYKLWCHAVYATCKELGVCHNILFTFYPVGNKVSVTYEGFFTASITAEEDEEDNV